MKRTLIAFLPFVVSSCAVSSLNPFHKSEPVYQTYIPTENVKSIGLKGIKNVIYYIGKTLSPIQAEIVLNSYDGYIINAGSNNGVDVGDRFVSDSGAELKVSQVKGNYCIALPIVGHPVVGENAKKLSFNNLLLINFAGEKGKSLYKAIGQKLSFIGLAGYEKGKSFKKKFKLRFPSDFRRRVPVSKLTSYDGYLIVDSQGASLYDGAKHLVRIFPWQGAPIASLAEIGSSYRDVLKVKGHATNLFIGNVDGKPDNEVVVARDNNIDIYHIKPKGLEKIYSFKNPIMGSYIFHICPIDINGNGRNEIIVDGFYRDTKSVASKILKLKDGKLKELASSNYILSGFDTNNDGVNDAIYGQTVSDEPEKLFGKRVFRFKLESGKLVKAKRISVPNGFQVTSAQMFFEGKQRFLAYYDLNYFFDVSKGKKVVWQSPIRIGASPNCIYWHDGDYLVSYYITPKPKVFDVDGDGNDEVFFSQNKNTVPHMLSNILSFDGGRVLMLYKNGFSFDWQEATTSVFNKGGIEDFDYVPEMDTFISIFTISGILKNPRSKILLLKPKV